MPKGIQIGKVAKETGLSMDAIRFYEKIGLLKSPPRSQGGYRLFGPNEVQQLRFIATAQALGFSLTEIRELLALRNTNLHACSEVRNLLQHKLTLIREKIDGLLRMEAGLKRALGQCNRELRHKGASHRARCPVLEEIKEKVIKEKPP